MLQPRTWAAGPKAPLRLLTTAALLSLVAGLGGCAPSTSAQDGGRGADHRDAGDLGHIESDATSPELDATAARWAPSTAVTPSSAASKPRATGPSVKARPLRNVFGDRAGFDSKLNAAMSGVGDDLVVGQGQAGMGLRGPDLQDTFHVRRARSPMPISRSEQARSSASPANPAAARRPCAQR